MQILRFSVINYVYLHLAKIIKTQRNNKINIMYKTAIFYNENSYCNSCMMCVRSCQLKAIKFIDNLPKIIDDYCVNCGQCYNNCPPSAIRYIDSVEYTKSLIDKNPIVVASLSPTWVSEFSDISKSGIIRILKMLGFTHISETSIGATQMINDTIKHIETGAPLTISSTCPAICSTVIKYYPHLAPYLSPIESPTVSHAKLLRNHYGKDIIVVGINSCVAEKINYHAESRDIDATVTYKELKRWMEDSEIDYKSKKLNEESNVSFDPFDSEMNHDYIFTTGSTLKAINNAKIDINFISFSGMANATNTLDLIDVEKLEKQTFVKLLACTDGCNSSSGSVKRGDNILKILNFKDHYKTRIKPDYKMMERVDITHNYKAEKTSNIHDIDSEKINAVLDSMYISQHGKPINCGKCGYPTCRTFAKGVVRGMTQKVNCVPHYQSILQDNFSIMIKNSPYSTFVVDTKMTIIDSNKLFQETIGISKNSKAVINEDVIYFVPFIDHIKQMIEDESDFMEKDLIVRGKMLRLTMFALKSRKFICGIVRNMLSEDALGDEIITRTRNVINDNIESVQKIAYLLGENASRTEALLSSMIDMHKVDKTDAK